MDQKELGEIVRLHGLWLSSNFKVGTRADLQGADLQGANLRGADLRGADLQGANLWEADLRGADLRGADLRGADLQGANLQGANLWEANLRGANLRGANLRGADLQGADLQGAHLPSTLKVDNLHKKLWEAINTNGHKLEMGDWHTCETTHCRAGWAIHLAGQAGYVLEEIYGAPVAGALIYQNSEGMIPNFYANNEDAMADIKKCAEGSGE